MQGPACPVPQQHKKKIVLGHGSGGQMSQDLIASIFLPPFDNPYLRANDDAGVVGVILNQGFGEEISGRLAISTDSLTLSGHYSLQVVILVAWQFVEL